MKTTEIEKIIKKHALVNAIQHDGNADMKIVLGRVMAESEEARGMKREIITLTKKIIDEVNALGIEDQEKRLESLEPETLSKIKTHEKKAAPHELPELEHASPGNVVMRIAPYPSGPLHIGNARMAILNDEYVKKYGGKLLLVFDDTIGSDEKMPIPEAYGLIEDGLRWLGIDYDDIIYKSDRVQLFYEWGERLIRKELAYVCACSADVLKENREAGMACIHREQSVDENVRKWKEMLGGKYMQGEAVLRLKSDIKHKNPAFRDRVLFRIADKPHPRVGTKYRVWPLLELSWAVDDYVLGITHVLRGKDLLIEDDVEKFIWNALGIPEIAFYHYGMLRVKEAKLSKSKFMKEVRDGTFSGWDDPRTWSLQSLRRRGIRPAAIRNFILSFGMSLADVEVPAENLYAENRRIVDPEAKRYFFVPNPVEIVLDKKPDMAVIEIPSHPTRDLGTRALTAEQRIYVCKEDFEEYKGQEVRLKDFCNVLLDEKATVTSIENKNIQKIQFVPKKDAIPVEVVMTDGSVLEGLGERNLLAACVDSVVQFERFGFARLDEINRWAVTAYFAHR